MATSGILGQIRAHTTPNTAVTVYTIPDANTRISGLILTVCNVSGSDSTYRIFQDDGGADADEEEALYWDVAIPADTTVKLNLGSMSTNAGTVRSSSGHADSLNFTLHGTKTLI